MNFDVVAENIFRALFGREPDEYRNKWELFAIKAALRASVVGAQVGAEMVLVPKEASNLTLAIMVRDYVGAERYARDHEYCDAQFMEPMRRAYCAMVAALTVGADEVCNSKTADT